jgi:hypothetical protein
MNAIHGKIKSRMILAFYVQTIQNKRWRNKERNNEQRKEIMNNYGQLCCPLTAPLKLMQGDQQASICHLGSNVDDE